MKKLQEQRWKEINSSFNHTKRKKGTDTAKRKYKNYWKAFADAKKDAHPDEELRLNLFNTVNTDSFERAIIIFSYWMEYMRRAMLGKKNFRTEIIYNAEEQKTEFRVYTPKESEKDGTKAECSEC